jgi:hypothetical protein
MKRIAVLLLILMGSRTSWSQSTNADYRAGAALFQRGDFLGAADKFKAAYKTDSDAGYLFDIAQAYRFANACELSAHYYRAFLEAMPDASNVRQVREWLASEESCADRDDREPPAPPPSAPVVTHELDVAPIPPPSHAGSDGGLYSTFAIGTLAIATISIGAAAYFTFDARDLAHRRETLCASGCEWAAVEASAHDLDVRGHRAAAFAIAGYATSAIAIAGTVALYVEARHHSSIAIAPMGGGGAMAMLTLPTDWLTSDR